MRPPQKAPRLVPAGLFDCFVAIYHCCSSQPPVTYPSLGQAGVLGVPNLTFLGEKPTKRVLVNLESTKLRTCTAPRLRSPMEPASGIEPLTYALRMRRSAD